MSSNPDVSSGLKPSLTPTSISSNISEAQPTTGLNPINASGGLKVKETDDLRANFSSRSGQLDDAPPSNTPQSSPLLSSTPPTVSKSLVKSYPYLITANKLLGIITWTDDSAYLSLLVTTSISLLILYFENIIIYFGHLSIVALISLYSVFHSYVDREIKKNPSLDDVIHCLTTVSVRADILLFPISSLNLTSTDLRRLLFTTIFLSPAYIFISYLILPPRTLLLILTLFFLTYHSSWSRVTRKLLWRSSTVRLLCFYVTGLDFESQHANKNSLFKIAMNKTNKKLKEVTTLAGSKNNGPVRFTYVLYENQRRWLGVGWTPNLLSYERTPWTDEFLNEADSPEDFELPQLNDDTGMYWRWVDKTWRLDLTNDGALQLPSSKFKTTADPKPGDGFIYYDNTWKNPSTEDSFSKYTRRRRWIRTAELVSPGDDSSHEASTTVPPSASSSVGVSVPKASTVADVQNISANGNLTTSTETLTDLSGTTKKRKSLRFDSSPTVFENQPENVPTDLDKKND
ncbi:hypothetical protein OGAPHI_003996 [Ogataea philodendri]|uniref:Peroxin/Ferlin domain-containing protein n=1 Tax=Ogataea philodendri TaxID=1378263 RepID=A0A9P8T4C8_9ASCO|nr:uncharacterized protein OGAPHI_003996 [Ogataea philodendri]KAH3665808.1 hypothetical protein OGAPHI_003996 [Ogataea philodendri]